jgi:serine/threonine-protein kinase
MELKSGVRLGPYEILGPLGRGGMGEVWKARDTRLNRIVAVKRLFGRRDRFEREARAIAALNHPHICQIYDVGPDFLVLEYVQGDTLGEWLDRRKQVSTTGVDEVLRLAIQIASALEEAHRHRILHRDLKPSNIMVTHGHSGTDAATAKILDFGIATLVSSGDDATNAVTTGIVGTAAYMSPEQAAGASLDERSDIFSLGAVLFEMFSGRRAFGGASKMAVLHAVANDDVAPLSAMPVLDRIVRRCLEKLPERRFQSANELRAALDNARDQGVPHRQEPQPSIAVLPFANMSADKENEYFGDGLAEEIINVLAQIPGLKVTARTSAFAFRGKEQDITTIAEALRVRTVLEGSVRRSGSRVRVTAQLIDAADGYHLWSDRYDRELTEAFTIQDEIARAITRSLHDKLAPGASLPRYQPNPLAYEAFLKARYYMSQLVPDALSRARVLLDQAIALDPGFALARQQLGKYYLLQALWGGQPAHETMPMVRQLAIDALASDASLSEAHALLGVVAGLYDYDWTEQERQFQLALARDPVSPDVYGHYGIHCLLLTGRPKDAANALERVLESDPLNLVCRVQHAICLDAAGDIEEADAELREVLELNEQCGPAAEWRAVHGAFRGKWEEASHYAERAFAMAGQQTRFAGLLAGILYRTGHTERANHLVATLGDGNAYGAPVELMFVNLMQSKPAKAAAWAGKAIEQRDGYLLVLLSTLVGASLRSSPHWPRLARLLNRPASP